MFRAFLDNGPDTGREFGGKPHQTLFQTACRGLPTLRRGIFQEDIPFSRDVLDIELAGFRIISTLLELMIDAVCSPEKAYSQLLINRVSGQYNMKAWRAQRKDTGGIDYISRHDGPSFALDLYRKINGNSLPAV